MAVTIVKNVEEYNLEKMENKLKEICLPLFKCSDVTYFQYDISFPDRSRVTLTTNTSWVYEYYNSGYYKKGMHHKDICNYKTGYNLWNSVGRSCVTDLARKKFEIDNGLTIIDQLSNMCEFYYFASYPENDSILNFYMNYGDLMKRFIAYFKCEARELIEASLRNKIKYVIDNEDKSCVPNETSSNLINNLFEETKFSRFYFNMQGCHQYLTEQELNVSKWLIQGKTAKEIAVILAISTRTVEAHIENIKKKLGCYKQTSIIHKLIKIGLDKVLEMH